MKKDINEKTFELNITNELLNLSKSFVWYFCHFDFLHFPIINRIDLLSFFNETVIFAEGLSQKDESNPNGGGYDVRIEYSHPSGANGRIMFLQYKSGERKAYCKNQNSKFYRQTAVSKGRTSNHIKFTFNDAANGTQHSTLQRLSNCAGVMPNSVFYVFPRITEKSDFINKVGNLLLNTSFVPVQEIDRQASKQIPPVVMLDGVKHCYRTSFDGMISEVNFFFFFFKHDVQFFYGLLAELICIQIERFFKIMIEKEKYILYDFLNFFDTRFDYFVKNELKSFANKDNLIQKVNSYLEDLRANYEKSNFIIDAPSKYTTIVPKEMGLTIRVFDDNEYASLKYQLF